MGTKGGCMVCHQGNTGYECCFSLCMKDGRALYLFPSAVVVIVLADILAQALLLGFCTGFGVLRFLP